MKEKTPTIVEVFASNTSKLVPKVMFGNTIDNQSPELDEKTKAQIQTILHQQFLYDNNYVCKTSTNEKRFY